MRKRWLLLIVFAVVACRAPQATQTIVLIDAKRTLWNRITALDLAVRALPDGPELAAEHVTVHSNSWPIERSFAPVSKTAFHSFELDITARDESNRALTQFKLRGVVLNGVTRYLYVYLDEQCFLDKCQDGVCSATVEPSGLSAGRDEARRRELYCEGGKVKERLPDEDTTGESSQPSMAATGHTTTIEPTVDEPGMLTMVDASVPANGPRTDSGVPTGAAGEPETMFMPKTDGACEHNPCGHGTCGESASGLTAYDCLCDPGYELDESQTTCVERNDCNKPDNGGCEDTCVPNELGEAECSCAGDPDSWLKADGTQCSQLQPELRLTGSTGSTERTLPQVAFDAAGNGFAVWTETTDNGVQRLFAARYHADSNGWDTAFALNTWTLDPAEIRLALAPNGAGLLLWTATSSVNSRRQLRAATIRQGELHILQAPIDKETESDVLMPALTVDAKGNGLVAWTAGAALRVLRYSADTDSWDVRQTVPTSDSILLDPRVALRGASDGLLAWSTIPYSAVPDAGYVPNVSGMAAFMLRLGAGLSAPLPLGQRSGATGGSDIVLDAQGRIVAVWLQHDGSDDTSVVSVVSGVSSTQNGGRLASQVLSTGASVFPSPRLAIAADGGTALAAWHEWLPSAQAGSYTQQLRAALRRADSFEEPSWLGLPSDTPSWSDAQMDMTTSQMASMSVEDFLAFNEYRQPSYDLVVGPDQQGFVVDAAYTTGGTPTGRRIWLQRVRAHSSDDMGEMGSAPGPIIVAEDRVERRPSPPRLAINANGDGAIIWDKRVAGRYVVVTRMLQ